MEVLAEIVAGVTTEVEQLDKYLNLLRDIIVRRSPALTPWPTAPALTFTPDLRPAAHVPARRSSRSAFAPRYAPGQHVSRACSTFSCPSLALTHADRL